jgi:hypothetical protein
LVELCSLSEAEVEVAGRLLGLEASRLARMLDTGQAVCVDDGGLRYVALRGSRGAPVAVLEPEPYYVGPTPRVDYQLAPRSGLSSKVYLVPLAVGTPARLVHLDGSLAVFLDDGLACPYLAASLSDRLGTAVESLTRRVGGRGYVYAVIAGATNPYAPFFQELGRELDAVVYGVWNGSRMIPYPRSVEEARLHGLNAPDPLRVLDRPSRRELVDAVLEADARGLAGVLVVDAEWRYAIAYPGHKLLVEALRWASSRADLRAVSATLQTLIARSLELGLSHARRHAVVLEAAAVAAEGLGEAARLAGRVVEEKQVLRIARSRVGVLPTLLEYMRLRGYRLPDSLEVVERGGGVEVVLGLRRRMGMALDPLEELVADVVTGRWWAPARMLRDRVAR